MANTDFSDSSKDSRALEREVEAQRDRVEQRIGEIRDRLSPGQLVDEMLSYTKDGGSQFAGNLGKQIASNPVPTVLLGISLAWLFAGGNQQPQHAQAPSYPAPSPTPPTSYPYARTTGGLRRVGIGADDAGKWHSEFEDSAGKRYKAHSDQHGKRLGHFADETGKMFSGFINEAGERVGDFRDEAGNVLHDAADWASHTWRDASSQVRDRVDALTTSAQHLTHDARDQINRMTGVISDTLTTQPLVGAALAFAAGAALGAALPHTRQEDEVVGSLADDVKGKVTEVASDLYAAGKEKAGEIYEEATDKAKDVYKDARASITDQANVAKPH